MQKLILFSIIVFLSSLTKAQETPKVFQAHIDDLVLTAVESKKIAGITVSVLDKGEVVYDQSLGYADIENGIQLTADYQFQIASITKVFTSTAILKLYEKGIIKLEDKASKYLTEFDFRGNDPTIKQLLNHTSGLPEYTRHLKRNSCNSISENIQNSIQNTPPYFQHGTQMAYSNSGYYLLGLIIEKVSNMNYDDFIERELLEPYGFKNISYHQLNDRVKRVKGYLLDHTFKLIPLKNCDPAYPFSAGSLTATSLDLVKWFYYLNSGKILKASSYAKMLEVAQLDCGHSSWYGLGLIIENDPSGRRVIRHGGIHPAGFSTDIRYYPEEDIYISVLINTNSSEHRPEKICIEIADLFSQEKQKPHKKKYSSGLQTLTGTYFGYKSGQQTIINIFIENGYLMSSENGTPPVKLFQVEENSFTTGPSIFGDLPNYLFIKKDTIKELHYSDNSIHTVLTDQFDPNIQYWQTGISKTSFVEIEGKKVKIKTKSPSPFRFPNQPVVVLEAGSGSTIESWGALFDQIGEFIPVIAYDRTGLGESEYVDHIPTEHYYADRLKSLLTIMGIEAPYVLVGHSYGGDLIRVFAEVNPNETSGLVLIDPVRAKPSEIYNAFLSIGKNRLDYDKLLDFIYDGDNSPLGRTINKYEKPIYKEVVDTNLPKPKNIPIVLLFAGQKPTQSIIDQMPFDIINHQKEINRQILKRLSEWMYEVQEGEMIILPSSSHYIHRDEPELTLEAIKDVVYPDIARSMQRLAKEEGIEVAISSYYKRKGYYPVEYFHEDLLNQIGYKFLRSEQYDEAIAVFRLNIDEYPNTPNPHDSLGDAYRLSDNLKSAVESYLNATKLAEQNNDPRAKNYRSRYEHYRSVLNEN